MTTTRIPEFEVVIHVLRPVNLGGISDKIDIFKSIS